MQIQELQAIVIKYQNEEKRDFCDYKHGMDYYHILPGSLNRCDFSHRKGISTHNYCTFSVFFFLFSFHTILYSANIHAMVKVKIFLDFDV